MTKQKTRYDIKVQLRREIARNCEIVKIGIEKLLRDVLPDEHTIEKLTYGLSLIYCLADSALREGLGGTTNFKHYIRYCKRTAEKYELNLRILGKRLTASAVII